MTVGIEQLSEVVNLCTQFVTLVGICHMHAMGGEFDQLGC